MWFSPLTLALLSLSAPADPAWSFDAGTHRAVVRLRAPGGEAPFGRPVRLRLDPAKLPAAASGVAVWDLKANAAVPAQLRGAEVSIDPGRPLTPGEERWYHLYLVPTVPSSTATPVQVNDDGRVQTPRYEAAVDLAAGGHLRSLVLKDGGRRVETLGDGIHWWVGRNPQVTQKGLGRVELRVVERGPVFVACQVTHPDLCVKGNSLTTEYRFYRDFIEVDHHYRTAQPFDITWLKLPVSVRARGNAPGLYSNPALRDQPLLTAGANGRWTPATWHDVSYQGAEPFGLGVICRNPGEAHELFFMDSVRPDEYEWIYAEPFGWERPVAVKSDFKVQLTIVPHPAGPGRYRDTMAHLEPDVGLALMAWQAKGAAPVDSDADGLSDLAELQVGTNPNAADTDGDGIRDGQDPDPLRGAPPVRQLAWPSNAAEPTDRPQTIAAVKPVGGVPTVVLDGRPYGPMAYTRCAGSLPQLAEMGRRNYRLHFEMVGPVGWPGEQEKTFRNLDNQLQRFLKEVPEARVILRLYLCNPRNFARDYPDQVMCFNDGDPRHYQTWYAMTDRPLAERGYPSFASPVWRQKTCEALHNYVTHIRRSAYAKNVVGYFICGGGTEEWYYWGDYDHANLTVDYSKPMLAALREHLRRRYDGDVTKLRAAWQDETADFATALPPSAQQRREALGAFWNPVVANRVRDYYYVHNKVMEDSVLLFARSVKQACRREQMVGLFHGYLQNHWLLEGGQATLREVLESPDIDFWSGPPQYDRRGQGEHGCVRFPMASLKANGKLWISESDIRTSFSEPAKGNPSLYGRPPSLEESLACLQREYGHMLCEGGNGWWFQMGRQWYHHEPILSLFDTMQRCGEAAMAFDRTSDTDIATVVHLNSLMVTPPWPVTSSVIDAFKVQETCRIGAPVDHWELTDLLKPGAKRYKLYLMLNCFSLSAAERAAIDQQLRRNGATLVWMVAPGLFQPDATIERDGAHVRDLLGFGLTSVTGSGLSPKMKLTAAGAAWLKGFDPQRAFGEFERPRWDPDPKTGQITAMPAAPTRLPELFAADGGEPLATYLDGGRTSMALRRGERATDVWIGSVMAPADLLRALARQAGCHLFVDADEIVYANHSFLTLHTRADGERTFRLRRPADVIEVFTGQVLGRQVTEFKDTVPAYRTRVYFVGDGQAWARERQRADGVMAAFQEANRAAQASTGSQ